jgi:hypothetical protein
MQKSRKLDAFFSFDCPSFFGFFGKLPINHVISTGNSLPRREYQLLGPWLENEAK